MKKNQIVALVVLMGCLLITNKGISQVTSKESTKAPAKEMTITPEAPETKAKVQNSIKDLKYADPAEEITLIAPPTANQMGSASLSYPIKLPPGRNGMEPQLSIQYNSEGGEWLVGKWLGIIGGCHNH